jgi:hypothetical protein
LPVIFNPADGSYTDTQGNNIDKPVPFKASSIGTKGQRYFVWHCTYGKLTIRKELNFLLALVVLSALADKHTVNYGYRQITQPDGRIVQFLRLQLRIYRGGQLATS